VAKRIRVDRCLIPPNVAAGMNPLVVMSLTYMYRATDEDAPPITVRREGRHWRIVDGRHRWVASVMAGRRRVLAEVV
jgi:SH3-like domain-containing protein